MTMASFSMITVNNHHLASVETKAVPDNNKIVIFCHGFRSSSIGPNRFFVRAAEKLTQQGIDTFRFDQYGSGNSEGDFIDSSFDDWINTTTALVKKYQEKGYQVALFGQSMGGATVISAAARLKGLAGLVAWAPDPSVDPYEGNTLGYHEESGERVGERFWLEAHAAGIADGLRAVDAPAYIVQCGRDEYVSAVNHRAITANAQKNHVVQMFPNLPHSAWSFDQATDIIEKSTSFIAAHFTERVQVIDRRPTLHLKKAARIINMLQEKLVSTILYGSSGVSCYLGDFKASFGDVDLLVDDVWLAKKWPQLQKIMNSLGYHLVNEHEHEFSHPSMPDVAFAATSILVSDGIMESLDKFVTMKVDNVVIQTLSLTAFQNAYEFSIKDGYRIKQRGKNDKEVIDLLVAYSNNR